MVMPLQIKLIAGILAQHADPDGTRVRPGNPRLAAITGKSERTIIRWLAVLRDEYRIIDRRSRGGGRGGALKTDEYWLVVPDDLLDRVELIALDGAPASVPSRTDDSGDTAVSGDDADRGDIHVSPQSGPSPVDKTETGDTAMARETDFQVTDNGVPDGMTCQTGPIEVTPGCRTTSHGPSTKDDQGVVVPFPTQLTTAADHDAEIPPSQCPAHRNSPAVGPCGACGAARRHAAAWARQRLQVRAHTAAQNRATAIASCGLCDQTGYVGRQLCDHDPESSDRAARGRALVRQALEERRAVP